MCPPGVQPPCLLYFISSSSCVVNLEKSKNDEITESLKNIKEGDIVEDAIVKATTDWGIFLDINGVDALLHVSDLSHGRVKKPADLVTLGQKLKVKITKIDTKTNRVSASVKALTEDPYSNIEKNYKVGEIYEGVCTKLMEYGAFVKLEDGIEGLIHNSELSWINRNIQPSKILSVSQSIKIKIVSIDVGAKRISLSYKAILENPWDKIKNQINQILIEADPDEADVLKKEYISNSKIKVLSYGLWSQSTTLKINISNSPGSSSVYKPVSYTHLRAHET